MLFATHDEAIAAIGPREAEVDAVLRRPWSPWAAMEGIMDKGHQHAAAQRRRLPGARDRSRPPTRPTSRASPATCGSP